jgi:hypothetical protein
MEVGKENQGWNENGKTPFALFSSGEAVVVTVIRS